MAEKLTENQRDVLVTLLGNDHWFRPMDLGGTDASHHSKTLASLAKLGLVERRRRGGISRPSWLYRITEAGTAAASEAWGESRG